MARSLGALTIAGLAAALVFFGLGPSACDDHAHATGPDAPIYEAGANDEALAQLDGAKPAEDGSRGPQLTAPAANAKLPASTPIAFDWRPSPTGAALRGPVFAPPSFIHGAPFGHLRAAHAHGTPMNGKAYLLVVAGPQGETLLRVFTTATKYQPDAAAWDRLKAAKQPLFVTLIGASFDNNNLVQGSAFAAPASTFTIE